MWSNIQKNGDYSKLMINEGSTTPVDEALNFVMELPEWADAEKIKRAQRFFLKNINAMIRTLYIGLVAIASTPTILQVLTFTKQSSTAATAYRRFRANSLHLQVWYKNKIEPGSPAWQSIETIRKMHVTINRRTMKANQGFISQKDMSITLFTFMGIHVLMPEKFGIVGTQEEFDAFVHFWRVIGFLLGIEDRFNCCGTTLRETIIRLETIREDIILPTLMFPTPEYESYTRVAVQGMWHTEPILHYESAMFIMKRALKVPGYLFFDCESHGEEKPKEIANISLLVRLRIWLDIITYEYLCKFAFCRWVLNIMRILFALLDFFPFLALWSFGKKVAYVEIMKKQSY